MNAVELELEKQRLRLEAASQRMALSGHAVRLMPLVDAADRVRAGAHWVGRHAEIVAGVVVLLAVARPGVRHFFWRWGRRAFIAWRLWRDGERWLAAHPRYHQKV